MNNLVRNFAVLAVLLSASSSRADLLPTVQNFDTAGTPFTVVNPTFTNGGLQAGGPTGNFYRIVQGQAITNSPFGIAFDRTATGSYTQVTADFDFRITSVFGNADGLAFVLLPTSLYGTSGTSFAFGGPGGAPDANAPGVFQVGFDTFDNSASDPGEPNSNHISLHFNNSQIAVFDNPGITLANGVFNRAHLVINQTTGGANVSLSLTPSGGSTVTPISNFFVSGYALPESRVSLHATAGAEYSHHDVDNINVQFFNSAASVPEPNSIVLCCVAGLCVAAKWGLKKRWKKVHHAASC